LEQLLVSHYVDENKPASVWVKILLGLLLLAGAGSFGYWKYKNHLAETEAAAVKQEMREAVNLLRYEPGIEVTSINPRENEPWEVFCLKDRLARSPEEVMRANSVDPSRFTFSISPYTSHERIIVERNIEQTLNPPPEVDMSLDANGALILSGKAPISWMIMARNKAMFLPGVSSVNMSGLSDPRMDKLREMADQVENTSVFFPVNSDVPYPEDAPKLAQAVDTLVEIKNLAESMGMLTTLTIYGHADPTGTDKRNYELSQGRARTIAAMLYNRGSSMPVYTYGMGSDHFQGSSGADANKRRIEMRLQFTASAQGIMENFKF
jgi:outer membrane protein OmpA-like peptidoglycan-associated protein